MGRGDSSIAPSGTVMGVVCGRKASSLKSRSITVCQKVLECCDLGCTGTLDSMIVSTDNCEHRTIQVVSDNFGGGRRMRLCEDESRRMRLMQRGASLAGAVQIRRAWTTLLTRT
jgi:hypothetical protein